MLIKKADPYFELLPLLLSGVALFACSSEDTGSGPGTTIVNDAMSGAAVSGQTSTASISAAGSTATAAAGDTATGIVAGGDLAIGSGSGGAPDTALGGGAGAAAGSMDATAVVTGGTGAAATGAAATGAAGTASSGVGAGGVGVTGAAGSGASVASAGAPGMGGATTGAGGSDGAVAGGSAGGAAGGGAIVDSPLPPISDYSQSGPFETTIDRNVGPGSGYTVFRPEPLGEAGFLHAPIVFGPGIGQQVTVHTEMLTNFASHGFVVVGTPVLNGGPGDAGNRMLLLDGLEWILAQNSAPGIYEGKLYVDHAVSMGFSVGGTSAVEVGGHAAVATVVSIHGHSATAELHGPMLQTTGTEDGLGMDLQDETYAASQVPTFLATVTGAPHAYIEQDAGGVQRPAIVAWMRYFIYNDTGARHYFYGDDCVLCMSPWENPRRKNWEP